MDREQGKIFKKDDVLANDAFNFHTDQQAVLTSKTEKLSLEESKTEGVFNQESEVDIYPENQYESTQVENSGEDKFCEVEKNIPDNLLPPAKPPVMLAGNESFGALPEQATLNDDRTNEEVNLELARANFSATFAKNSTNTANKKAVQYFTAAAVALIVATMAGGLYFSNSLTQTRIKKDKPGTPREVEQDEYSQGEEENNDESEETEKTPEENKETTAPVLTPPPVKKPELESTDNAVKPTPEPIKPSKPMMHLTPKQTEKPIQKPNSQAEKPIQTTPSATVSNPTPVPNPAPGLEGSGNAVPNPAPDYLDEE